MAPPSVRQTRSNSSSDMSVDQKLDLLLSEISEIKTDNKQFKLDIAEFKEDMKELKKDLNESVEMCFNEIKDCVVSVKINKDKINEHEEVIQQLTVENVNLKKQVNELQKTVRSGEQYSRSNCLEITGVPEIKSEIILDVVKRVTRVVGFQLKEHMIDAVHRLSVNPNNPQAPRGIIVKFCRRIDLEELRRKTRVKNGFSAAELGFESESKVFVNLSLSRETRILWAQVRAFKNDHNYKFAWITSAGKVFVKREEGARAVHISEKSDLDRLK